MNRGLFLKNLGLAGAAVAVSPLVSLQPKPKRLIYKVDFPAFGIFYSDREISKNGLIPIYMVKQVNTWNGTLKQLCDRHPNDHIFFYEEINDINHGKLVRACIMKKEVNIEILLEPNYKV